VVRPATIYGPRSQTLVVEIVKLLQQRTPVILGSPTKSAGLAYVTNVVDLLLLAADSDQAVGQAYNVCDGLTVTWRQYIDRLAEIAGVPSPRWALPRGVAYGAGWAMEQLWELLQVRSRPLLTRMVVELFCTDQGFPIEKACRELGYEPRIDFDEGMRQVDLWLHQEGYV
jgi:nucleoside-diphosphate-sugar epimerase